MNMLTISSELAEVEKARNFLSECLRDLSLPEEDYFRIELALVEICTNIILYAYPERMGKIFLRIWQKGKTIYLEVRDDGIPFNPKEMKEPDINAYIDAEKKGGLGIFLVRKIMDGFSYKREEGQNILTMSKKISGLKTSQ